MPAQSRRSVVLFLALCGIALAGIGQLSETAALAGAKKPVPQSKPATGKQYALVIGVNYERSGVDRRYLPTLKNAERDAETVAMVLTELYDFDEVTLLLGSAEKPARSATFETISTELQRLADIDRIKPEDSVLFYFSGHGVRVVGDALEHGRIFARDVKFDGAKPVFGAIGLHKDVHNSLVNCPSQHKLIVLDSCHSGEIFTDMPWRQNSEPGDEMQPCLRAMASCTGSQVSSDGTRGENSPFTSAFVSALRRLPTREAKNSLSSSRVFLQMQADFSSLRNAQTPASRNLAAGDGDFMFWPSKSPAAAGVFKLYAEKPEDFALLQAMVPGEYGKWWFDETPWFIPSLRREILDRKTASRGSNQAYAISTGSLLELALTTADEVELQALAKNDSLVLQRVKHFRELLKAADDSTVLVRTAEKIAEELAASVPASGKPKDPAEKIELAAEDLHLLAVLRHYLDMKKSDKAIAKALADSATASAPVAESVEELYRRSLSLYDENKEHNVALAALCHCDQATFLLTKRDWTRAQRELRLSLEPFLRDGDFAAEEMGSAAPAENGGIATQVKASAAPAAFLSYVLFKESDAWRQQNRWADADSSLDRALAIAKNLSRIHGLTAAIHRQRGWCFMEQWRIREAETEFIAAQKILAELALQTSRGAITDANSAAQNLTSRPVPEFDEAADARPALDSAPSSSNAESTVNSDNASDRLRLSADALAQQDRLEEAQRSEQEFENLLNFDYDATIDYLHNLHGLAMVERFEGHPDVAASDYRLIVRRLMRTIEHLAGNRSSNANVSADVEARLYARLVNTQERLGDCNLFGNSELSNPADAADDYRRALSHCTKLTKDGRRDYESKLRLKQALALSLPSPVQDIDYARNLIRVAEEVEDAGKPSSAMDSLHEVCAAVMQLYDADATAEDAVCECTRREQLRLVIEEVIEGNLGQLMPRDRLEQLLLAAKVLVDRGAAEDLPPNEAFLASADAELLLNLCRQALPRRSAALRVADGTNGESCRYLRPYYDSVMRSKLARKPKHVKELLEVHWEATRGEAYIKSATAAPILALYALDDKCWLLLDVPRGVSQFVDLEKHCSVKEIRAACAADTKPTKLALPPAVYKELALLASLQPDENALQASEIECWWLDPIRKIAPISTAETSLAAQPLGSQFVAAVGDDAMPSTGSRHEVYKRMINDRFPFALPSNLEISVK